MAYEKIVTVYNTVDKAKEALRVLQASGFHPDEISVMDRNALGNAPTQEAGFWRRLFGGNVWEHEAEVYSRTLKEGGAILSLRVPHEEVARAMSILDVHGPVDVHEKAASYNIPIPTTAKSLVTPPAVVKAAAAAAVATTRLTDRDEVVRLAEEQLNVGKRLFEIGTTRIRRYVIEKPVEAQVTLHEEHTEVARRAITDPAYVKDIDWTDRMIEVTETTEQPVVTKTARVAEEVVIRKKGSDRVETVRDTVRRQELDVERIARDKETRA
ncbi:MAG TPA: YsnF/AvaK domain-containing protein [Candidatus Cybelea sp.]|nr:YsnF/AvaK domain-containing protein [Candidatus Cybelea sp.]